MLLEFPLSQRWTGLFADTWLWDEHVQWVMQEFIVTPSGLLFLKVFHSWDVFVGINIDCDSGEYIFLHHLYVWISLWLFIKFSHPFSSDWK